MSIYDYFEIKDELLREVLTSIKDQKRLQKRQLVDVNQYKTALNEFIKYGCLMRFPEKIVFKWKRIIINNIALLDVITEICGHSQHFPFDEFNDVFFYCPDLGNYYFCDDFDEACELMESYGDHNILPKWSNGHYLLSDYGLPQLLKVLPEFIECDNSNRLIVLINQIMDISHQRSNLSELFIKNGFYSLEEISK